MPQVAPSLRAFADELVKLAAKATGPSHDPFKAQKRESDATLYPEGRKKTMGPPETRTSPYPPMDQVANRPYREKVSVKPIKPIKPPSVT